MRQKLPFSVVVPGRDVAEAGTLLTAAAEPPPGERRTPGALRVRSLRDGRLRIGLQHGPYTNFPRLDARLEQDAEGQVWLTGTAVEAGTAPAWVVSYGFAALMMAAIAVLATMGGPMAVVLVCGAIALLFALLARGAQRARRTFPLVVAELLVLVDGALKR